MPERRIVTVLFCDVIGSTAMAGSLDPEEWGELMNSAFAYLIAPVERYQGTIARLMGDAILAFFGAPAAHEDDPQRAIMAALDILEGIEPFQERVRQYYGLDFNIRIGVNTGLVVVGGFGSDWTMEYTAVGDAINLADNLQQTASPGTIQVSQSTYRLIEPYFEVEALEPLDLKGKSRPEPVYRVLDRKRSPGRSRGIAGLRVPTVGRGEELEILRQAVDDLWQGQSRIICLIGDAGLGKSRLIEDLYAGWRVFRDEVAGNSGGRVPAWFSSQAVSFESTVPYGVIQRWIREIFAINDQDSLAERREKLTERLQFVAPGLGDRSVQVAERLLAWSDRTASQENLSENEREALKRELFAISTGLWRSRGLQRPTVFVAEDMHWADEASLELLMHWFQLTDELPLLFLCSFRPDRQSPAWTIKQRTETEYPHRYTEIILDPLTIDESGEMVDSLLNVSDASSGLRDAILQKSEGNPLFVEEVIRGLVDQGAVEPVGGNGYQQLQLVSGMDPSLLSIPNNLQALLLERIDRLEPDTRRTLQLASVIGRSFYYRVLETISDAPEDLDRHLSALQRAGLVREVRRVPEPEYTFRHALTWEAAYSTILRRQRREYHRRVGEAMEQLFADRVEEYAAILGHHFYEAGDDRTAGYYIMAGDAALALSANVEAASHYARGVECIDHAGAGTDELTQLYLRYGRALELISKYVDALTVYEEMERIASERHDQHMKLAAMLASTTIYVTPTSRRNEVKGIELAQQALSLAREIGDHEAEAKALWSLMVVEIYRGRATDAAAWGEEALAIAREFGMREQLAYILNDISDVYLASGEIQRSARLLEESHDLWLDLGNTPMLVDNAFKVGFIAYLTGDYERVLTLADETMAMSRPSENIWGEIYSHWLSGMIADERGDIGLTISEMEEAIRLSSRGGLVPPQIYLRAYLGLVYARTGDHESGLRLIEEARSRAAQFLDGGYWFDPVLLAHYHLLANDPDRAEEVLRGSEDTIDMVGMDKLLVPLAEAEIALQRGEWQRAFWIADDLVMDMRRVGVRTYLTDALYIAGRALIRLGRDEEAREILFNAIHEAETLGIRRMLWRLLWELSQLETRRGNHEAAANLHQRARDVVEYIAEHTGSVELRAAFLRQHDAQPVVTS